MNSQAKKYTEAQISLLNGQIRDTNYGDEVQTALAEMGKTYSSGYVRRVVGMFSYNNDVWDAVTQVLKNRKKAVEEVAKEIEQLVVS